MTVVNRVVDETVTSDMSTVDGTLMGGIHLGSYFRRVSSGADRPPGERPGYIRSVVMYQTKPFIFRGSVWRESEKRTRTVYKPDPRYTGYQVPHPYTAEYVVSESGNGLAAKSTFSSWRNFGSIYNLNYATVPDPWTANDSLRNIGKLREQIVGSDFNLAVALGEAPRSLNMITKSATTIYNSLRAVKRGDPLKAARLLFGTNSVKQLPLPKGGSKSNAKILEVNGDKKLIVHESKDAAASNWLALQYGWIPLVNDISSGAIAIDHQLRTAATKRYRVTAYAGGRRGGDLINIPLESNNLTCQVPHRQISSERIIATLAEKSPARLTGLMDVASVAWELLPWSFVADWVIPVGSYLESRSFAQQLSGTFVITRFRRVTYTGMPVTSNSTIDSKLNLRPSSSSYVKVVRTVSTTLPVPVPTIQPLGKVLSWKRAANAVALLAQFKP